MNQAMIESLENHVKTLEHHEVRAAERAEAESRSLRGEISESQRLLHQTLDGMRQLQEEVRMPKAGNDSGSVQRGENLNIPMGGKHLKAAPKQGRSSDTESFSVVDTTPGAPRRGVLPGQPRSHRSCNAERETRSARGATRKRPRLRMPCRSERCDRRRGA